MSEVSIFNQSYDLHVVQIAWDEDHFSPPIGPFRSYAEAQKFATECRKRLRASGRKSQGAVKTSVMASPQTALDWLAKKR